MILTERFIAGVREPGTYWDDALRSFGLRVGKNTKTFIVIRDGGRRLKVGRFPSLSLSAARTKAKKLLLAPAPAPNSMTLRTAVETYEQTYLLPNYRPKTAYRTKKLLDQASRLYPKPLSVLTAQNFTSILDDLPPSQANHVFGVYKTFFNWCERREHCSSPISKLAKPHKEKSRSRVLSDDEIAKIWRVCPASRFGSIVKLLILTGQRRGEIAAEVTPVISDDTIMFPHTKNGLSHTIPITPLMKTVLADYEFKPFYSEGKNKAVLDEASGVSGWVLHDLRRTWASKCAELGVLPHVIERCLNHQSGTMSPIARTYNRHAYLDEMRHAFLAHDAHIAGLIA